MLIATATCALVLTLYVWLISIGSWSHWPTRWYAYDALANSFRRGQLALAARPNPALLALSNPYDPLARQGIPFPQDVSLYNGRFYYYWGPVPAFFVAIAKSFISGRIGDQYTLFLCVAGIFLLESILLVRIRARFFSRTSPWTLIPAILAAGLANPLPVILGIPSIYTAAIAAGQFFFLAGFITALSALNRSPLSIPLLLLTGFLWGASLGSRITQMIPIGFLMLLIATALVAKARQTGRPFQWIIPVLSLASIAAFVLAGLAWYNWARFGSIFETGIKYQLAGVPLLQYGSSVYSLRFVIQNLFNYLLNPPTVKYAFPYFSSARAAIIPVVSWLSLPSIYHAQEVTGLLVNAPYLLLAVVPLARILRQGADDATRADGLLTMRWLVMGLAGSLVFGSVLLLSYFWAAERFLLDFIPALILLAVIGVWQLGERLRPAPRLHIIYWVLVSALILASAIVSILLSMSFNSDGFRQLNPVLWRQLSNLFRP